MFDQYYFVVTALWLGNIATCMRIVTNVMCSQIIYTDLIIIIKLVFEFKFNYTMYNLFRCISSVGTLVTYKFISILMINQLSESGADPDNDLGGRYCIL